MSNIKPDSVIACLDCPDHVKAVLDASMWAAKNLNAPLGLMHAMRSQHQQQAIDYSGCLNIDDESHLLASFTQADQNNNSQLKSQGQQLLAQAQQYCQQHYCKQSLYTLHRHSSWSESIDYVDDEAQLLVIGHHVTCKTTLSQLIRPSSCPILVTHTPFLHPKSALFAFDNRPTCHQLLKWLCQTGLARSMTVHVVMVGKDNTINADALREAYARLKQAGIKCKKSLIDSRDVTASLLYYQQQHELDMLMTGAFGESRLLELFKGSDTEKLLGNSQTPYLLFPSH